jgi:hypothetical protein
VREQAIEPDEWFAVTLYQHLVRKSLLVLTDNEKPHSQARMQTETSAGPAHGYEKTANARTGHDDAGQAHYVPVRAIRLAVEVAYLHDRLARERRRRERERTIEGARRRLRRRLGCLSARSSLEGDLLALLARTRRYPQAPFRLPEQDRRPTLAHRPALSNAPTLTSMTSSLTKRGHALSGTLWRAVTQPPSPSGLICGARSWSSASRSGHRRRLASRRPRATCDRAARDRVMACRARRSSSRNTFIHV